MGEVGAGESVPELPKGAPGSGIARITLNALSGAIPFAGGLLSAIAGEWSEKDQKRVNDFLHHWARMLAEEMREKEKTILEITARLDMKDEKTAERVASPEYQSLLRKGFRDWAGTESEAKRVLVRNILSNAAGATFVSDDVIKLFLEWIKDYSELHFAVVSAIYNSGGITRGSVWEKLGRGDVREDSADADLFKLIFRDLSTGGIVRQHRETDGAGNFIQRAPLIHAPERTYGPKTLKSAFDDSESYELTKLGDQFVHYAMTDLPVKIEFQGDQAGDKEKTEGGSE
jgi:hypothetical protein